jgi:hypothetical protein
MKSGFADRIGDCALRQIQMIEYPPAKTPTRPKAITPPMRFARILIFLRSSQFAVTVSQIQRRARAIASGRRNDAEFCKRRW